LKPCNTYARIYSYFNWWNYFKFKYVISGNIMFCCISSQSSPFYIFEHTDFLGNGKKHEKSTLMYTLGWFIFDVCKISRWHGSNIPSKFMRTPYCHNFTCVSLSSFLYLHLSSRALLVDVGTFDSDVDPNLVWCEHSDVTRWGIFGPTSPKY
jgi:hypothetical protein